MSASGDEARCLQGQKKRHPTPLRKYYETSGKPASRKTGSGMTQNKLDGPQSGKLCKTFKLTKRERASKRQSLSSHEPAQKTHKAGKRYELDSDVPPEAPLKAALLIMQGREDSTRVYTAHRFRFLVSARGQK